MAKYILKTDWDELQATCKDEEDCQDFVEDTYRQRTGEYFGYQRARFCEFRFKPELLHYMNRIYSTEYTKIHSLISTSSALAYFKNNTFLQDHIRSAAVYLEEKAERTLAVRNDFKSLLRLVVERFEISEGDRDVFWFERLFANQARKLVQWAFGQGDGFTFRFELLLLKVAGILEFEVIERHSRLHFSGRKYLWRVNCPESRCCFCVDDPQVPKQLREWIYSPALMALHLYECHRDREDSEWNLISSRWVSLADQDDDRENESGGEIQRRPFTEFDTRSLDEYAREQYKLRC